MIPFPNKKYKIIYADPPWEYRGGGSRKVTKYYDTMTPLEIADLPVKQIRDEDSILFLWVTFPNLSFAFDIIKKWGFKYSTVAFIWIKKNINISTWFMGCGNYTRSNAELVLLGTHGKGVERKNKSVTQIITTPIKEHSQKPDETRTRILQLCGDLPRIELFARTKIHGWDTWGNDPKLELQPLEAFSN